MVLYYDTRLDHTRGVLTPGPGPRRPVRGGAALPGAAGAAGRARDYPEEARAPTSCSRRVIDDAQPPLRVAPAHHRRAGGAARPAAKPWTSARPVFTSARVSQYPFGIPGTAGRAGDVLTPPEQLSSSSSTRRTCPSSRRARRPSSATTSTSRGLEFVPGPAGRVAVRHEGRRGPGLPRRLDEQRGRPAAPGRRLDQLHPARQAGLRARARGDAEPERLHAAGSRRDSRSRPRRPRSS